MTDAPVDGFLLDRAQQLLARQLPPTPLVPWRAPGGAEVLLKLETLQPSGSFKVRGALNALAAYRGDGVVTASAGNHALGMAEAARLLGGQVVIVVPGNASRAKVDALRRYPVELHLVGAGYEDAEREALRLAGDRGLRFVSAYNDPAVVAGQSSVVAEVSRQIEGPVTVVVPVGGGGLVAGSALEAARHDGRIRVVGVEAAASRAVSAAVGAGHTVPVEVAPTICDGLAGNIEDGCFTPDVVRAAGVEVLAASEDAVRAAVRDLALDAGVVVEGSAAVTLAAVAAGLVPTDRAIVLVLTGRNIAAPLLADLVS